MFGFWPIYKRELKTYLQSPSTWVLLALVAFVSGIAFYANMREFSQYSAQINQMSMYGQQAQAPNITQFVVVGVFQWTSMMIMFTMPMLAMRLVAEEKSRGTFELMVTCPISDWAILLGKYFALLTIGVIIIGMSGLYPMMVAWLGRLNSVSPEWPIVASCWIGLMLIFATYAAFGLMASSFTENQVIAAVITLIGIIAWFMIGAISFENEKLQMIMLELSASRHIENFNRGMLSLKDFAFYLLFSFFFLFVASKTLDARRWRV